MKISVESKSKLVDFSTLNLGDIFYFKGTDCYYLKVKDFDKKFIGISLSDADCVDTFHTCYFNHNAKVRFIDKLKVEK